MTEKIRTALRTAETFIVVVGIPEVGFLQYAYTARKPHSVYQEVADTALLIALASGKAAVNLNLPKGLSRASDRQISHPRNQQIRFESVSM